MVRQDDKKNHIDLAVIGSAIYKFSPQSVLLKLLPNQLTAALSNFLDRGIFHEKGGLNF